MTSPWKSAGLIRAIWGYLCSHGPISALAGADRFAAKARGALTYASAQPPTASTAALMACQSSQTEPCRQYASRTEWSSQRAARKGSASIRSIQRSRQSPRSAGSGGRDW